MKLKFLLAIFAFSGVLAANESSDEDNYFVARATTCYCCSGFVVKNIAGTRCGSGGSCDSSDTLCCQKGAIVYPPVNSQNNSAIVCKG
ncbi:uncharacterized protein N7483_012492 [Penicillium malachiteum]|uniref:uncharacterized protein n=1 Tax=Penicillium malachiteum TaxID=1324776 RepID=UPI00254917EF|nr:uncharacterized protein N7483_012492 [Penicillium malachiteum]KAJ5715311.1 hypothetical protein N7483_012492 [Penicillium malachiteum]